MFRELELPEGVRAPMRRGAERLCNSVAGFLRDGSPESLASARAELTRIIGVCRLFCARRAALFCVELENLLASLQDNLHDSPQSPQGNLQHLLTTAVLRLQEFIFDMSLPVRDEQFDVTAINPLRAARGKRELALDASQSGVLHQLRLPDFLPRVLEKIVMLQADMLDSASRPVACAPCDNQPNMRDLASLLQVCGLPVEIRHQPKALVHMELHFRYLSEHCQPCTAQKIASTPRLAGDEYLLIAGRRRLVCIFADKIDALLKSVSEVVNVENEPDDRGIARLTESVQEFLCINAALALLVQSGIMSMLSPLQHQLLVHGVQLCRHISCAAGWRLSGAGGIHEGAMLLVRVTLLLQQMLLRNSRPDRHADILGKRICRDCTRFITLRQRDLRRRIQVMHELGEKLDEEVDDDLDKELLVIANTELESCRNTLQLCLGDIGNVQGLHHVSEILCSTVSKFSQSLLIVGQVELHEIMEELRNCLAGAFERQHLTGDALQDVLRGLCELLHQPLSRVAEQTWCDESTRQRLADRIARCVTQTRWQPGVHESMVAVTLYRNDDPKSSTPVPVENLPVHLASSIRDLLFCAEELELCLNDPARFEELNRRLIVELRMLATGARALHVDRVARLSAVLAEVHQAIASLSAGQPSQNDHGREFPLSLLVAAHQQLRSALNQAAARQEVSSSRDIIAALYQWLEDLTRDVASPAMSEGFTIFHREAEELMLRIEERAGRSVDDSGARMLLHHFHTLKGSARMFGADAVAALCHRCEQVLLAARHDSHVICAVAESGDSSIYMSGDEIRAETGGRSLVALVQQLRAAVDELLPIAGWQDVAGTDTGMECRLPQIPLATSQESSIVIPEVSLRRMAELTAAARTGSRAMSDVLRSCYNGTDDARLVLLADLLVEQERCTQQLGEEIAGSTRISFARLTPRLQRLAGRHANMLDKQVSFQVQNDALRADRTLVESLVAPLEHLLRNAIDHGIEPVLQRRALGKSDSGTITLVFEEMVKELVIALTDDGAGIDTDTLPEHATRLGIDVDLHTQAKERLQWLFLPGFSCREVVTEAAGHGIGLAMVSATIARLGGRVALTSVPGQGCCFRIVLPL